jgi:hypothetical protein
MSYKAAVLTVSDSAAKDAALDTTGPWIASSLKSHEARLFSDVRSLIVPDKIGLIDKQVNAWIQDEQIDLIITTGGTGWSEKDVTVQVGLPSFPLLSLSLFNRTTEADPSRSSSTCTVGSFPPRRQAADWSRARPDLLRPFQDSSRRHLEPLCRYRLSRGKENSHRRSAG